MGLKLPCLDCGRLHDQTGECPTEPKPKVVVKPRKLTEDIRGRGIGDLVYAPWEQHKPLINR